MKNDASQYIAKTGLEARKRLSLQHRVFAPGTQTLLEMANFQPDMRVLIVGCGCGDETIMIARQLNEQGRIVAIDISQEQIEQAKRTSSLAGLADKITFLKKSVYELNSEDGEFDLIICRFVIPHFENPKQAIELLKNRLRQGGILAAQEPLISTCRSEPVSPALTRYMTLMMAFGEATKRDFDMAIHLPEMFEACGLITHTQKWQPRVFGADKRMVSMSAAECTPAICKLGLISDAEAISLIKAIEDEVVNHNEVVLLQCENVLVTGERPKL